MLSEDNLCVFIQVVIQCISFFSFLVYILGQVLFMDHIFLLLGEYVKFFLTIFEPRVTEDLNCTEPFARVNLQQLIDQVRCMFRQLCLLLLLLLHRGLVRFFRMGVGIVDIIFAINDKMVELRHAGSFEWHCANEHSVQANSCTPYINFEAIISLVFENFRGNVGWGSTLLIHALRLCLNLSRDTKVCYFNAAICI